MREAIIARRYATALLEAASAAGNLDRVRADLAFVRSTLAAQPEARAFFVSPRINPGAKKNVIQSLFGGRVERTTMSFLTVLVDRRRESYLDEIADSLEHLANLASGLTEAEIRTAVPMDATWQARFVENLQAKLGRRLAATFRVDPDLRGGVVVRIGDTVYDGSIKRRLEIMHARLAGAERS